MQMAKTFETLCTEYRRNKDTLKLILAERGVAVRRRGYATGTVWHSRWQKAHYRGTHTDSFRAKSSTTLSKVVLPRLAKTQREPLLEQLLAAELRAAGICFMPQSKIGRYRVDFEICQDLIVIEADGFIHTLKNQRAHDKKRDYFIASQGCKIFRFTRDEITQDVSECIHHVIIECNLKSDVCQIML